MYQLILRDGKEEIPVFSLSSLDNARSIINSIHTRYDNQYMKKQGIKMTREGKQQISIHFNDTEKMTYWVEEE